MHSLACQFRRNVKPALFLTRCCELRWPHAVAAAENRTLPNKPLLFSHGPDGHAEYLGGCLLVYLAVACKERHRVGLAGSPHAATSLHAGIVAIIQLVS